jgi:hypothetical protein
VNFYRKQLLASVCATVATLVFGDVSPKPTNARAIEKPTANRSPKEKKSL